MKILLAFLGVLLFIYICVLLVTARRQGKLLKVLGLTVLSGIIGMVAVNLLTGFTGVRIPVNWWTVGTSSIFGLPGVIALLVIKMFF